MKIAFSVLVDVDNGVFPGARSSVRDEVAEDLRAHLVKALEDPPVVLRDVRVWGRATPERVKRMKVESIMSVAEGYRVSVRVEDSRTTSRRFATRQAAEAWADTIDPLFLPGDPLV